MNILQIEKHFNETLIYWILFIFISILVSYYYLVKQQHPIYILLLIILLVNLISLLLRIWGAEYIALLIIIIYTGVIAVLFLSIIIIYYHDNPPKLTHNSTTHYGLLAFLFFIANIICYICFPSLAVLAALNPEHYFYIVDIEYLTALYNDYAIWLVVCGVTIFFTIIGSLLLTYYYNER